ncbi:sensor domain-containing diguanylate cyclase [Sphingomonas immobilis]|uniref:diguanylate cyclase n=1 Tax=Sphingomonas immobilis TaxID=3063997 RepID=A0ABT8ZY79_9SPHN|nr:diguanylate cyclase [Sphingomonas sp. CA1-15]MDO7842536.1 diguanylate cyclase [Sphingomonas sp. CA1-15]
MSPRQLLPIFLFLAALLCGSGAAHAQAGSVGTAIHPCIVRAAPGVTARALFRTPAAFDCTTPQPRFGPGDYWVISQPLNAEGLDMRLAVRSSSTWQRVGTIHALYDDGHIVSIRTDDQAATRTLKLGAIFQRWLPRTDRRLVRLLWHIEGSQNLRGMLIAPTLATAAQSSLSDVLLAAFYASFCGLCLALLLFNMGLAHALRHRFMAFYCVMMVGLLAYGITSSGALAWIFPDIPNTLRLRINYTLLAMVSVSALAFLCNFFEEGIVTPALRRVVRTVGWMVTCSTVCFALLAPWQMRVLDTAYALSLLSLICALVPILINAWRRQSAYLGFFTLAWSLPLGFALARAAFSLGLTPYSFWVDNSTIASMALEALLSSLAIAHRILLIARERDEAREQEMAARLLADTDPLTGLLNRRAFLREAIGREGEQVLIIADLDHFKRVNETIGHDGGDEVLRIFARTLRQSMPEGALIARLGGEEFGVVAARGKAPDPQGILERLRVARMPFDIPVTASIGTCVGPLLREADWKMLYHSADRALFEAKTAGRDRVQVAAAPERYAA